MWDTLFGIANLAAMIGWVALILLPRRPGLLDLLQYGLIGLFALFYATCVTLLLSGAIANPDGGAVDFGSIAGVRAIFASDAGVTVGWVHYLAFDMFVGLWIARHADRAGVNRFVQAPILFFTFMAGPFGLLLYYLLMTLRRNAPMGREGTLTA